MPVRWKNGEGYVTTGVDSASESNLKSANELGISIDEFHALMSSPVWALTVLGVRDEHPEWDLPRIQYQAINLMFHSEQSQNTKSLSEMIAVILSSR